MNKTYLVTSGEDGVLIERIFFKRGPDLICEESRWTKFELLVEAREQESVENRNEIYSLHSYKFNSGEHDSTSNLTMLSIFDSKTAPEIEDIYKADGLPGLTNSGWEKIDHSTSIIGNAKSVPVSVLELTVDTIDVESAVLSEEQFSEIAENGISEDELDEIYFENETTIAGCEFKSTVNGEVSEDARVELKNQYSQEIERLSKEQTLESNENASPLIRREGMVENARYKLFISDEFDPAKLRLTLSDNCFLWQRRTGYYNFDIEYDGRELEYCDADETNYSEAYLVASDGTAYEIETVDD